MRLPGGQGMSDLSSTTTPTNGAEAGGLGPFDEFELPTVDLAAGGGQPAAEPRRPTPRRPTGAHGTRRSRIDLPVRFSILGRGLRFVAGVDETLMDKVRWERSWYACLGAVVLGTSTIAAF